MNSHATFSKICGRPFCYPLALVLLLFLFAASTPQVCFGAAVESLEKRLKQEKDKAQERKTGLKRLTEQEKKANANLAATENKILTIERNLDDLRQKMDTMAASEAVAEREIQEITAQRDETLQAQSELMVLLWSITNKRETVGSREMADWDITDREYRWSKELLSELERQQVKLETQQIKLEEANTRRNKLYEEIQASFSKENKEKDTLLQLRLSYEQQVNSLRQKKASTEEELTGILKLVDSLNFQIEKAGRELSEQKGNLALPAKGVVKKKFSPNATPAFRGLGIATAEKESVHAVAAGKVVHNNVLRGLGKVVILQHGKEYYTVYAYLGDSSLKMGQQVEKNAKIGNVGFFPEIKGPGLYFELRFRQKAINPEQWLASR